MWWLKNKCGGSFLVLPRIDVDFACCYCKCGKNILPMNFIRNDLRNNIGEDFLNGLVCKIECNLFQS